MGGIAYRSAHLYRSPFTYRGLDPFVSQTAPARSLMQATLQQVPTMLGELWQFRRLTSGPAADAQTYTPWVPIWVEWGEVEHSFAEDTERGAFKRVEIGTASISDAIPVFRQGDEAKDPLGNVFKVGQPGMPVIVRGNDRSGTTDYRLVRVIPTKIGPSRGRGGY